MDDIIVAAAPAAEPQVLPEATSSEFEAPSFTLSDQLVVATRPTSVEAESFRALRSNLLAQHVRQGRRSLAISAASAGAGCSFVAANLAMAMAQAGVNTLLIDGNMRDPSLEDYIRPAVRRPGLSECLKDDSLALAAAITPVQPSLSVLFAGEVDDQAFDRLGAPVFRSLIGQCLRDFDLTIIDTPPSNLYADARRIASIMRYSLVVTCRGRSYLKDVRVLVDELVSDDAHVIGTYLNDY